MTARTSGAADGAVVRRPLLRDGEWFEPGDWFEVRSPYDGARLADVAIGTEADVRSAIAAAHRAMTERPLAPHERSELLFGAVEAMKERREELARPAPVPRSRGTARRGPHTHDHGDLAEASADA